MLEISKEFRTGTQCHREKRTTGWRFYLYGLQEIVKSGMGHPHLVNDVDVWPELCMAGENE